MGDTTPLRSSVIFAAISTPMLPFSAGFQARDSGVSTATPMPGGYTTKNHFQPIDFKNNIEKFFWLLTRRMLNDI